MLTPIIRAMVAAGCTPEQILAAVEAAEAGEMAKIQAKRAKDAARQARKRYAESRGVTRTERDLPPDGPPSPRSPLPPLNPPTPSAPPSGEAVPTAKRATRIPDNFPTRALFDEAVGRGLSPGDTDLEAEKFRNFWLAKAGRDGTKLDWPATWRNWVIKAIDDRVNRRGGRGPPGPGSGLTGMGRIIAEEAGLFDGPGRNEGE